MADERPVPTAAFEPVSREAWRALVDRDLAPGDFERKLVTRTPEGIAVQPLYTAADLPTQGEELPGQSPFRRGAEPLGRWDDRRDVRVAVDHPDPDAARRQLEHDLRHGMGSLWLRLDDGGRLGRDETSTASGLAWISAADAGALLAPVDLTRVPVVLDAGGNALPAAALLLAAARARGVDAAQLAGSFGADPLGALAGDGTLPGPLATARTQLCALARWAVERAPKLRAVTISTLAYHDAGADAAQELGFALATGAAYLRWLTDAGLDVEAAGSQVAFRVAVGNDVFMEVAKLRALRWLWAEVVRAAGGSEAAQAVPIHAVTSARTRTQRDPWVNMLRETAEAFAAVVGGADAVTTSGFDAALGASDAFGRRIALNTQLILDEEARVGRVADPGGGSYYVESLTDALARKAWERFRAVEAAGGMAEALAAGHCAKSIEETANTRRDAHARRMRTITGVSEFADLAEAPVTAAALDIKALAAARRTRIEAAKRVAVDAKRFSGLDGTSLVDAVVEAAALGVSLGSLTRALAGDGATAALDPLPRRRDAAEFERLRDAADRHAASTGRRAKVFLASLGPLAAHKPRTDFASGFLAAGGIDVAASDGYASPEAAAAAFAESDARVACICGTDAVYAEQIEPLAKLLRQRGAVEVIVAGRPGEHEAAWRAAGVGAFIHVRSDVVTTLEALHAALGVRP